MGAYERVGRHGAGATEGDANMLMRGDNLTALAWLEERFGPRFRCIYLDPPFNTGRTFREYKDARSPAEWTTMMRPRLERMRRLLADDGALFAEIDDTQLGDLLGLLDELFGREQRVSVITVVRSASTGHKTINPGPVNVADYLLVYARSRRSFRPNPLVREREGRDPSYRLFLENRDDPPASWRFVPLGRMVAASLGFSSVSLAARALGRDRVDAEMTRFALDQARSVVRFAQPRYEAVSAAARAAIDRSRASPDEVVVLARTGKSPFILKGGNRLLFLGDKVREVAGRRVMVEALTNVWDDVPFQGIAREGGVTFGRNKKPERLLQRVLDLTTAPGDWVLDPFLGSGTTAAVAHKMGRRWVGIEAGPVLDTLAVPRLLRVVQGQDDTGITHRVGWAGGGGFAVHA